MPAEEWRPIPGFDGYEASSLGRIRSKRRGTPRVLRPHVNSNGYLYVSLGRISPRTVHSLIAAAFHGPRPEGQQVRHLDGHQQNNAAPNLTYGSASENSYDAVRHGTHPKARRTHCPHGHPYSTDNTYLYQGRRFCRTCKRNQKINARLAAANVSERAA